MKSKWVVFRNGLCDSVDRGIRVYGMESRWLSYFERDK